MSKVKLQTLRHFVLKRSTQQSGKGTVVYFQKRKETTVLSPPHNFSYYLSRFYTNSKGDFGALIKQTRHPTASFSLITFH